MWLTPCSSRTSSAPSPPRLAPPPRAAAPKTPRLDSWPVAPNGARGITVASLGPAAAVSSSAGRPDARERGSPGGLGTGRRRERAHLLGGPQQRAQLGQPAV